MSLAILQRSDGDLTLVTVTEDASALARKLEDMQPFDVEVFAEFRGKASLLHQVQEMLQTHHCSHCWYNLPASHVVQFVCKAFVPLETAIAAEAIAQEVADTPENMECDVQDASEEDEASQTQQIDPEWHSLLEPCSREEADKATVIRRTLKKTIGRWQADSVLSTYKEACLRIGACGRYFLNSQGQTMRLAADATKKKKATK
jgi:hypothetical protein